MLIDFKELLVKYGTPTGIIHIGAHKMEERDYYLDSNINDIIWVEANPALVNISIDKLLPTEHLYNHAVSDVDGQTCNLNITNNGMSSSILKLDVHKQYYPNIQVVDSIALESIRMDTLVKKYNVDILKYNFLNLDIQGTELLSLKGFGDLLKHFKYIYSEIYTNYLYKNCCLVSEIDDYLSTFNFNRVETKMTQYEWGDALYVRNDK